MVVVVSSQLRFAGQDIERQRTEEPSATGRRERSATAGRRSVKVGHYAPFYGPSVKAVI